MHPLESFKSVAQAIAGLFGPHTEVVVHDIVADKVFAIVNDFSGRKVGDSSDFGPRGVEELREANVLGPYEKMGPKGERISSISAVLRDDAGEPVGLLCINVDYSRYREAFDVLKQLVTPPKIERRPEVLFRNDWQGIVIEEVQAFKNGRGIGDGPIPPALRRELLKHIDKKGLLYARKSVDQLTTILKVSRATLYKDLAQIRANDPLKAVL